MFNDIMMHMEICILIENKIMLLDSGEFKLQFTSQWIHFS